MKTTDPEKIILNNSFNDSFLKLISFIITTRTLILSIIRKIDIRSASNIIKNVKNESILVNNIIDVNKTKNDFLS